MAEWDDEILIGEGVALDSGAAPVTMRMVSGLIDAIIYFGALIVSTAYLDSAIQSLNGALQGAASIAIVVTFLVLIPTTVETLTRGRSAGRMAMGLRIVRDDGGPVSARHALGRAMTGLLEIFATVGLVAVSTSMLSARGKRIGDFLSGTYAMRTRGQQRALAPIVMPPHLEAWATSADIRRLPDGLALSARMFLSRAATMHLHARARLGTQFAAEFERYVSPPPPAGTHPETFITAVLAARREREYANDWRQSQRNLVQSEQLRALPYGVPDTDN